MNATEIDVLIAMLQPDVVEYPGWRVSALIDLFNKALKIAESGNVELSKKAFAAIGQARIHDPNPLVREWAEHCRKMLYSDSYTERRDLAANTPRIPNDLENSLTDAQFSELPEKFQNDCEQR